MRPHPWIVALALVLAGVMAFGTTVIVRQNEARRLRRLPLPAEAAGPVAVLREWVPPPVSAAVAPEPEPARAAPAAPVAPTGRLSIRVTGPHGLRVAGVEAHAIREGDPEETQHEFDDPSDEDTASGTLAATELPLGRYEVVVEAPFMREVRVQGVQTNGQEVSVVLERAPVLRGAVGRAGEGERGCSGMLVFYELPGAIGGGTSVAGDCTFQIDDLPAAQTLTLVAKGRSRRERALVTLPLTGDPAFVCFAPPCAEPTPSIVVYVADTRGEAVEGVTLNWSGFTDGTLTDMGLTTISGMTYLHGRHAGETLNLSATRDERVAEATVTVGAGVTDVVLTMPAAEGGGEPSEELPTEAVE